MLIGVKCIVELFVGDALQNGCKILASLLFSYLYLLLSTRVKFYNHFESVNSATFGKFSLIITCDPSIYTMDHPKFIASSHKEESVCA